MNSCRFGLLPQYFFGVSLYRIGFNSPFLHGILQVVGSRGIVDIADFYTHKVEVVQIGVPSTARWRWVLL